MFNSKLTFFSLFVCIIQIKLDVTIRRTLKSVEKPRNLSCQFDRDIYFGDLFLKADIQDKETLHEAVQWYNKASETKSKSLKYKAYSRKFIAFDRAQNYLAALECCVSKLELKPNSVASQFRLVFTLAKLERYKEAFAYMEEKALTEKFFSSVEHFELKLSLLYGLEKFERAILYLKYLIDQKPFKCDLLLFYIGLCWFKLNNYTEVLESFERVEPLELSHEYYSEYYFMRGKAFHELKQYTKAIDCFPKAKQDFPTSFHSGIALLKLERFQECIRPFELAISLNPSHHQPHFFKACALKKLKHFPQAIDSFDMAIQLNPNLTSNAFKFKGICLQNLEKYHESIDCFEKCLAIKPDDHEAWHLKGSSLYFLEEFLLSCTCLGKAIELKADFRPALKLMTTVSNELNIFNVIINQVGVDLRLEKQKKVKCSYKGLACCLIGDFNQANVQFDTSLQLSPDFTVALYAKASVLTLKLGQYAAADECLDQLIQMGMLCYRTFFLKALVLDALGMSAKAIAFFEKAVKYLTIDRQNSQEVNAYRSFVAKLDRCLDITSENIFEECVEVAIKMQMNGVALKNINKYIRFFYYENPRSFYLKGLFHFICKF